MILKLLSSKTKFCFKIPVIVAAARPLRFTYKTSVISLLNTGNVINKVIILNTNHNSLQIYKPFRDIKKRILQSSNSPINECNCCI